MSDDVNTRRRYDSTRRQEQARATPPTCSPPLATRFLTNRYTATTVPAIASAAGTSVETVYKAFGDKPGLREAVFDVTIAGERRTDPGTYARHDPGNRGHTEPANRSSSCTERTLATSAAGPVPCC